MNFLGRERDPRRQKEPRKKRKLERDPERGLAVDQNTNLLQNYISPPSGNPQSSHTDTENILARRLELEF